MILKNKLINFEKKINFKFKNKNNLIHALVHPSYLKDKKNKNLNFKSNFERLEFLGDRVLGLSISNLLFSKFENFNEGDLTKKLSYLVQKKFLLKIAIQLKIENILKYSFKKNNLRTNNAILSDSIESLIGGIYLDSGYDAAFKFIKTIWYPYLDSDESNIQDAKTNLQEISQKKYKSLPIYSIVKKEGPPHSPIFTVSLKISNLKILKANGSSKQDAEKNAAKKALELLNEK